MINAIIIQQIYNKLYEQLRRYIWELECVEVIAELEMECYKAIPKLGKIQSICNKLKKHIKDTMAENEDLQKSFNRLYKITTDNTSASYNIKVMEAN